MGRGSRCPYPPALPSPLSGGRREPRRGRSWHWGLYAAWGPSPGPGGLSCAHHSLVRRHHRPRPQTRSGGLPAAAAGTQAERVGPDGGFCRLERARPSDRHGACRGWHRPHSVAPLLHEPRVSSRRPRRPLPASAPRAQHRPHVMRGSPGPCAVGTQSFSDSPRMGVPGCDRRLGAAALTPLPEFPSFAPPAPARVALTVSKGRAVGVASSQGPSAHSPGPFGAPAAQVPPARGLAPTEDAPWSRLHLHRG